MQHGHLPNLIHAGTADHHPFVLHAAGQLQCRPRALPGLHVPHNDPTQHFPHKPVPVGLPHSASGFSALPAATAAPAVLSDDSRTCTWWIYSKLLTHR